METQNQLDQQIQTSFQIATAQRKKLEKNSSRFTITGIAFSALATFTAGVPSIIGEPVLAPNWRITCTVAALLTLAATIVTSVQNQIAKPDALTQSSESVVRLRVLLLEMQSPDCDHDQIRNLYQGVLLDYPELNI